MLERESYLHRELQQLRFVIDNVSCSPHTIVTTKDFGNKIKLNQ
jgi:hypothetical protein